MTTVRVRLLPHWERSRRMRGWGNGGSLSNCTPPSTLPAPCRNYPRYMHLFTRPFHPLGRSEGLFGGCREGRGG